MWSHFRELANRSLSNAQTRKRMMERFAEGVDWFAHHSALRQPTRRGFRTRLGDLAAGLVKKRTQAPAAQAAREVAPE